MPAIAAVFRSICHRLPRRLFSLIRLLRLSCGRGSVVHPSLMLGGRGTLAIANDATIERGVNLTCSVGGRMEIGTQCSIEEFTSICVPNHGRLRTGPETRIGRGSQLIVAADWSLGTGSRIGSFCEIFARETVPQPGRLVLGGGSVIGDHALIDLTGDLNIEDQVSIGPYSIIYTHDHRYREGVGGAWKAPLEVSQVVIEAGAWVGARVTILHGVRIGRMAVVATGSVVTRDVPARAVYGGIPAKPLNVIEQNSLTTFRS